MDHLDSLESESIYILREADAVERNGLAEIVLRTQSMLALDPYRVNPATGRFMLVDNFAVVGGVTSIDGLDCTLPAA